MKKLIFVFLTLFACTENQFSGHYLSFELRLAEDVYQPDLEEYIFYNSQQSFYLHDSTYLTNEHIDTTEIINWQDQPQVMVTLTARGRQIFSEFTRTNIGKKAAMLVDRKLVSAPLIRAEIAEGKLIIVGLFNHDEAVSIARGILPRD